MIYVKHAICQCFFLIILFFKNHQLKPKSKELSKDNKTPFGKTQLSTVNTAQGYTHGDVSHPMTRLVKPELTPYWTGGT